MESARFSSRHGLLVAKALEGSWRKDPAPCELSRAELVEIAPILLQSGAAALVWWRFSQNGASDYPAEFFQAYKEQTLEAAVHENDVAETFVMLQQAQLKALVVKGWAIARLYPDPGLRRYSDLDLCVQSKDFASAASLLKTGPAEDVWIDLHEGSASLDYAPESDLFDRSVDVAVGDTCVRVPSPEDHLRILCLHLLRHGCWRPLWLCDVALALESRAADFDWQIFFGNDANRADWLACVLGLAHRLLGARVSDTPTAKRAETLPGWLVRSILRRWSRWFNSDYRNNALPSLLSHKGQPMRLLEDAYFRFDPIRATVEVRGAFSNTPRLPYQLAALARRTPGLLSRILKMP